MRVVTAAVLLLLGCGERPASTVSAPASTVTNSTAPAPTVAAAPAPLPVRRAFNMPPPIKMPDGGMRFDMRGQPRHVRTLERQADGTYKQACVSAPATLASQGTK